MQVQAWLGNGDVPAGECPRRGGVQAMSTRWSSSRLPDRPAARPRRPRARAAWGHGRVKLTEERPAGAGAVVLHPWSSGGARPSRWPGAVQGQPGRGRGPAPAAELDG